MSKIPILDIVDYLDKHNYIKNSPWGYQLVSECLNSGCPYKISINKENDMHNVQITIDKLYGCKIISTEFSYKKRDIYATKHIYRGKEIVLLFIMHNDVFKDIKDFFVCILNGTNFYMKNICIINYSNDIDIDSIIESGTIHIKLKKQFIVKRTLCDIQLNTTNLVLTKTKLIYHLMTF